MKITTLKVEGMSCEGCANAIRRAVGQLDGVREVKVDLAAKRVSVAHDEAKASQTAIRKRIEEAGYQVVD